MKSLSHIVESAPTLFHNAQRETLDSVRDLEHKLDIKLPSDVVCFCTLYGSGLSNALPSLSVAIKDTLRFRQAVNLPPRYVVIDDRNDAGVVILDTSSSVGRVIWLDSHAAFDIANASLKNKDFDQFDSFKDWISWCIDESSDAV